MYVTQSDACSVANSTIPASPAAIAAAQALLGAINTQAVNAQQVFTDLCNRTDLNTNGWPLSDQGGMPAGPTSANPSGGNPTGLKSWPVRKGRTACIVTAPTPEGAAPSTPAAYAQIPAPPMPSLVTQGRPSYNPKTGKVSTPGTVTTALSTAGPNPLCSQYQYGSLPYIACLQKLKDSGVQLVSDQMTVFNRATSGLGCSDSSTACDFLAGMMSAVGLAAAVLYLYDYLKRSGRIQ
jgi:hypothetical protein